MAPILPVTNVVRVASIQEAARRLAELGPSARLVAGGTDTLTRIRQGASPPRTWVDLSRVGGAARTIRWLGDELHIGALVDFQTLASSEPVRRTLRALWDAASIMGSLQIRGRGTLGGNIAHASPAGDAIPPLVVSGARLQVFSPDGVREEPVETLFRGPGQTTLEHHDVIAKAIYPVRAHQVSAYHRIGSRAHHVINKVSMAVCARWSADRLLDVRVALGAVAPTVVRAPAVETLFEGRAPSTVDRKAAADAAEAAASPITDLRSTREYRLDMCRQLVDILVERLEERG